MGEHAEVSLESLGNKVKELMEGIAEEEGFIDPSYTVIPGSSKGDNYLGIVHRIKVEGQRRGSPKIVEKSFIVKCQPSSAIRREKFRTEVFFKRESRLYNEIIPAMRQFQEERGIPDKLISPQAPTCYHASDLLIFDDLCQRDFKMCDRREPLDHQHCSIVLKELARFHAVSFAIRDQNPELYRTLCADMDETFILAVPDVHMKEMFDSQMERAMVMFEERSKIASKERYTETFQKFAHEYYKKLVELIDGKNAEPYAVISHGDPWINNFLFQYDPVTKDPSNICLIDFQLARHSSPAIDICHFLLVCSQKSMRDLHLERLFNEYHSTLSEYLLELGSNPEILFPYEAFQDQLKRFGRFGLALAILCVPVLTCNSDEAPDLDAACEGDTSFKDNFVFTHSNDISCWIRVCDAITDMVDLGYI